MKRSKKGFTMLELLVVVAIIAIVATLATGAAMKSIRQGRRRRIDTMRTVLEMALVNYRAEKGEWPFTLGDEMRREDGERDNENDRIDPYWCKGKDNKYIFTKLYEKRGKKSVSYLDPSSFFVYYKGGRKFLKDVPEADRKNLPLGYPDVNNQDKFIFFSIEYNPMTDSVKVH